MVVGWIALAVGLAALAFALWARSSMARAARVAEWHALRTIAAEQRITKLVAEIRRIQKARNG